MFRHALCAQLLGLFPLDLRSGKPTLSSMWTKYSLVTASWTAIYTFSQAMFSIYRKKSNCFQPIYIFTDTIVLMGSIPVNIASLLIFRSHLYSSILSSYYLFLKLKCVLQRNYAMNSVFILLLLLCALSNYFSHIYFNSCPFLVRLSYSTSLWLLCFDDIAFFKIYDFYIQIFKQFYIKQNYYLKNGQITVEIIKDLRASYLTTMLNIKVVNNVFGVHGLFIAVNCFTQLVGFGHFVFVPAGMNPLPYTFTSIIFHFTRLSFVCWMTTLPATYLTDTTMLELLSLPRAFGVLTFGQHSGVNLHVKSNLVARNIVVTIFMSIVSIWLVKIAKKNQIQYGGLSLWLETSFAVFCLFTQIILSWEKKALCNLFNKLISISHDLPLPPGKWSHTRTYLYIVVLLMISTCSVLVLLVDFQLWIQSLLFMILFIHSTLVTLIFLELVCGQSLILTLINKSLDSFCATISVYRLRKLKEKYLLCLSQIMSTNEQFTLINFLKSANVFGQCVLTVNYVYATPPQFRTLMILSMSALCSAFFLDLYMILNGALEPLHKVQETAKFLEKIGLLTDCDKLRCEIETFSLQLYHIDVEFDACGFFKLNLTLIQSMVATIVAYAFVIRQFA